MKILIIEDDTLLEKTLELRLRDMGHEVIPAENGKQALQAVYSCSNLDVLICDVLMPELSGPSFLREIRKRIHTDHITVIMISALSDGKTFMEKLEVSYDYYLPKPFTFYELNAILQEVESKKASRAG